MKFPNAASGVKKIYIAQILALFATLCTGAALVYASIKGKGKTVASASRRRGNPQIFDI